MLFINSSCGILYIQSKASTELIYGLVVTWSSYGNLRRYEVRRKTSMKKVVDDMVSVIKSEFRNRSGIIYCFSKAECERLCQELKVGASRVATVLQGAIEIQIFSLVLPRGLGSSRTNPNSK